MSATETLGLAASLATWARRLGGRVVGAAGDVMVLDLADDSREVGPGALFFARPGATGDGTRFVRDALSRGAVAVVAEQDLPSDVPQVRVPAVAPALQSAADLFFDEPQRGLTLVGITGTKGKTTTAWLTAAALRAAGLQPALLGTIHHDLGPSGTVVARNTTPGLLETRRLLAQARQGGCRSAVLEVSSHALSQGRVAGLEFAAAVFTNLGRDHLDFHGDEASYFGAKRRLFEDLGAEATAVLCRDDPRWADLAAVTRGDVLTYGTAPESDLRVQDVVLGLEETRFALTIGGDVVASARTPLVGRHNLLNVAAAVGVAAALGVEPLRGLEGACAVARIPGRLQRVEDARDLHVFVDYAHTEEALRQVLSFLREIDALPLSCVVGCGGNRDRTKRPRMAHVAAELSERLYLTSDNPRDEDPSAILRDMEAGLTPDQRERTVTIVDRREAIARAIAEAPRAGCVLIAGKGHETYQILGQRTVPFDDAEEARQALGSRSEGGEGGRAWSRPERGG